MFISPALAHGSSGAASGGGFGPLILLAIAIVVVLVFVGEANPPPVCSSAHHVDQCSACPSG